MKHFMAIYMGGESDEALKRWEALAEPKRRAMENDGKKAWMNWAKKNHGSIVDPGAPLGKTKLTSDRGVSDINNRMAAYTIVKAKSHEEAAKLFIDHPHFTIFPGDSVEIMECLPMPEA